MPGLYAAADVYALVSTYEPFGVAVREAAAAGLPIICTKTAGAAGDVAIDGRNALLINPFSVDDIAGALERLAQTASSAGAWAPRATRSTARPTAVEVDAFAHAVLAAARRRGRATPAQVYAPSSAGSTSS